MAWFDGVAAEARGVRGVILDIVGEHGKIGKQMLVELTKEALGDESPGVNKIRAWVADLVSASNELVEVKDGNYRLLSLP